MKLTGFYGATGNSLLEFAVLMQQKPSTHAFGANVHYMNSMTREKNGLIEISKDARTVQEIEQMSRVRARADQWFPFIHLILSTMSS